jgi:hypothetical protein
MLQPARPSPLVSIAPATAGVANDRIGMARHGERRAAAAINTGTDPQTEAAMKQDAEIPAGARKAFPLRLPADVLSAVQRWAADDLRSVNAQIEYLLRQSLRDSGRLEQASATTTSASGAATGPVAGSE